jgi:hypothetical protein
MDNTEALQVLTEVMEDFRREPYRDLIKRIDDDPLVVVERQGAASAQYQLEVSFLWDGRPGGNVMVIGSIDDGGLWTSFSPVTRSFIKAADESFVGE